MERQPSIQDPASVVSDEFVRSVQVIHTALAAGIVLFAVIVLVLYFLSGAEAGIQDLRTSWLLTAAQFAVLISVFPISFKVFDQILRSGLRPGQSPTSVRGALQTALILRLALIEGCAIFGLTVCIVAVFNGNMAAQPLLWINMAGAVGMLAFVSWSFPTRERLIDLLKRDSGSGSTGSRSW